jgi:hypothetical protein
MKEEPIGEEHTVKPVCPVKESRLTLKKQPNFKLILKKELHGYERVHEDVLLRK